MEGLLQDPRWDFRRAPGRPTMSPSTISSTTLTPIMSPKQPHQKKTKNPACTTYTTSTASATTTPTTTTINLSVPTILPKKPRSKRTKKLDHQITQITIPKRSPPTLYPFISIDFRLKRHKNILSRSHTTEPASQHTPPPVPLPLPPPP